jgi:capsular exopolysaccharide synthesis family protein
MSCIYEALKRAESEQGQVRTFDTHPVEETAEFRPGGPFPSPEGLQAFPTDVPCGPWKPDLNQLPTMHDHGPGVEQFRSLRSRVYQVRDHQSLTSILVSSGMPAEGKTFVAANLAVSLARNKRSKVLLIDGDLRRPQLHRLLGTDQAPGLSDYLAGTAELKQIMRREENSPLTSTGAASAIPCLTFIPAGVSAGNAAELTGNRRFDDLMAAVSPHFDWIIVDSSPVLPVSDAVNLARPCDAVLLVACGGVTPYEIAQRAHAEFRNSRVLGFVLNAVKGANKKYGYGYGFDAQPHAVAHT